MFCGAWLQDGLNNILLFAPLGLALAWSGRRITTAGLLSFCLSLVVELLQWRAIDGRDAALHDLLANTAGGFVGAGAWHLKLLWPSARVAARASGVGVMLVGAYAGAPGRWFVPVGPTGPYYAHLNPRTAPFPTDAALLDARWNGRTIRCCPDPASAQMQFEAASGAVRVAVEAKLAAAPLGRGRLLTIWDANSQPLAVIGVNSDGVWASVSTLIRAAGVRDFAIGLTSPRPWRSGDAVSVEFTAERGVWRLVLDQNGQRVTSVVRQRPIMASYLFLPNFAHVAEPHHSARWIAFVFPAMLLGWCAAFTRTGWRWLVGPSAALVAFFWGEPWYYPQLAVLDLGLVAAVVLLGTAIGEAALHRPTVRVLRSGDCG